LIEKGDPELPIFARLPLPTFAPFLPYHGKVGEKWLLQLTTLTTSSPSVTYLFSHNGEKMAFAIAEFAEFAEFFAMSFFKYRKVDKHEKILSILILFLLFNFLNESVTGW
jgi:hypothetical protein